LSRSQLNDQQLKSAPVGVSRFNRIVYGQDRLRSDSASNSIPEKVRPHYKKRITEKVAKRAKKASQAIILQGRWNRDDRTAIELLLCGVRAVAMPSFIIGTVRNASRFSSATGGNRRSECVFDSRAILACFGRCGRRAGETPEFN
jgi:hypothetical protein